MAAAVREQVKNSNSSWERRRREDEGRRGEKFGCKEEGTESGRAAKGR